MEKSRKDQDDPATDAKGTGIETSQNTSVTSSPTPGSVAKVDGSSAALEAAIECEEKKQKRTPGLRIFDTLLYPILTNFVVFGMSVAATYLTTKGGDKTASGKLVYGKTGEFFFKRGEWLKKKFTGVGMSEGQADMAKMVFFSFADGSIMAPVIKMAEDRREHIGKAIDHRLGTLPEDDSVYDAEPKQGWLSVLGGRLATVSIVVPTAVVLDKTGLNDKLFTNSGKKLGDYIASKPGLAKYFGKLDIPEIGKIGVFEAFYTSVCTAGLYFSSRFLARRHPNKDKEKSVSDKNVVSETSTTGGTDSSTKMSTDKIAKNVSTTVAAEDTRHYSDTVKPNKRRTESSPRLFSERVALDEGMTGHAL